MESNQIAEQNSTRKQDAFQEKYKQYAMEPDIKEALHGLWSLLIAILVPSFCCIEIMSRFPRYIISLCVDFRVISLVVFVSGEDSHLRSHRRRWWLCTLEAAAVVLDKFIIMRACAARSCRTLTTSSFMARHGGKKVASEAPETLECVRQRPVSFAALLAAMTCLAGLSTLDASFLSDMKRQMVTLLPCFGIISSLAVLTPLMRRPVTGHGHGLCSRALRVSTGAALIGLTGVFAIWGTRSLTTIGSALLCIGGLQVLALSAIDASEKEDHHDIALSDARETTDADQYRQKSLIRYHFLLATLAASITYNAGLNPPGGFCQANATTDAVHHYHAGDQTILRTAYPRIYKAFFYCNAAAFMASMVILMLLLAKFTKECRTRGIKYCALQVPMTLDTLGLIGAYATGNCSEPADPAIQKDDPSRPVNRNNPREATWRVSSSAPHHMTGNQSLLLSGSYMDGGNDGEVVMVHPAANTNGEAPPLRVRGSGSVRTESITLDDVWYVPGLDANLLSTGQLARQGCAISLGPGGCRITSGGALVGTGRFTEACQFELDFLKMVV